MKKDKIRKLISSNRLEDALNELKEVTKMYNDDIQEELILIEHKLHSFLKEKRIGILSYSDANITQNRVTHSLLELLNKIDDKVPKKESYDFHQYPIIKILFVSSGFNIENRLRFDEEYSSIKEAFYSSDYIDKVKLTKIFASTISDLTEGILEYKPQFVHFSGHGSRKGISLLDFDSDEQVISNNALERLFEFVSETIQCVFLSSCYSESQAKIISKHIPFVVGIKELISDRNAIELSTAFYREIGKGVDIETAFNNSKLNFEIMNMSSDMEPILKINKK